MHHYLQNYIHISYILTYIYLHKYIQNSIHPVPQKNFRNPYNVLSTTEMNSNHTVPNEESSVILIRLKLNKETI